MQRKLSQEQEILRETVREFARKEVSTLASKIDWECIVPQELYSRLAPLGLFGMTAPPKYGGAGVDFLSLLIACEVLSMASGSIGAQISFHNALACGALELSSNSKLKERLLTKLCAGNFGAFAFPRQDGKGISCEINGNQLVIGGSEDYIMNAAIADVFVICAKLGQGSAIFAFSRDDIEARGFSIGERKKLLGMRATATAKISFDNFKLPLESLVFDPAATSLPLSLLKIRGRLAVASQALGIGQAALDSSSQYANERKQFSKKIGQFYAIQDMIASDSVALETSRSMCYDLASNAESENRTLDRDSSIVKISASNAAVGAARHCIRVHGGYGFTRDYPGERYARDARLTQIYLESNEELKSIVAKSILAGH